jgi:hypothetical protein
MTKYDICQNYFIWHNLHKKTSVSGCKSLKVTKKVREGPRSQNKGSQNTFKNSQNTFKIPLKLKMT